MHIYKKSILVAVLLMVVMAFAVEGDVNSDVPSPIRPGAFGRDTVEVIIGSPYIGNVIPFWGQSYNACRFQVLFYQTEINISGNIIKFAFMPSSSGFVTGDYYRVKVLFCHTSVSQLSASFDLNYTGNTPVEVLSAETLTVGGAQNVWMDLPVDFPYNNLDNLLVEITWSGDAGTNIALWRTSESVPRRLYAWSDQATTGTLQNTGNYVRLTIDTGIGVNEVNEPVVSSNTRLCATPNPFMDRTSISYEIAAFTSVTLDIYDAMGRLVKSLVDAEHIPGTYHMQWCGLDNNGRAVENGVFFCRLQNGDDIIVMPIVYVR